MQCLACVCVYVCVCVCVCGVYSIWGIGMYMFQISSVVVAV